MSGFLGEFKGSGCGSPAICDGSCNGLGGIRNGQNIDAESAAVVFEGRDVTDRVVLGSTGERDQLVVRIAVDDPEVAGCRSGAGILLQFGKPVMGRALYPADRLQPPESRQPGGGEVLEVVVIERGSGDHDPFGGLEHAEVVGQPRPHEARKVAGVPFEARLEALPLPFADLNFQSDQKDQGDRHRQGDRPAARLPVIAGNADEGECERRSDEDAHGVSSPPVPPTETDFAGRKEAGQRQGADADAGADQPAHRGDHEEKAQDRASAIECIGKTDPAERQGAAGQGLQHGPDRNASWDDPIPSTEAAAHDGFGVGDQRADQYCRPDAGTVDQHACEGDSRGRKERSDVTGWDRDVQGDQATNGVGDGDSKESTDAEGRVHRGQGRSREPVFCKIRPIVSLWDGRLWRFGWRARFHERIVIFGRLCLLRCGSIPSPSLWRVFVGNYRAPS